MNTSAYLTVHQPMHHTAAILTILLNAGCIHNWASVTSDGGPDASNVADSPVADQTADSPIVDSPIVDSSTVDSSTVDSSPDPPFDAPSTPFCGAPSCGPAALPRACDIADGTEHTFGSWGSSPDPYTFSCAGFQPGASAVRLTLPQPWVVDLTISGPPVATTYALALFRSSDCTPPSEVLCTQIVGDGMMHAGHLDAGIYYLVVKSTEHDTVGPGSVRVRATLR